MPTIFISYARVSQQFATRLARSLETAGADVFLDVDDIPVGSNWSNTIQLGLDRGQVMVLIITPESMASKNVSEEWQYFLDEGKAIIPILLQPARVHFQLRRLQYIDFYEQDYDRAFRQLLRSLAKNGVQLQMPPITPSVGEIADEIAEARATLEQRTTRRTRLLLGLFALVVIILAGVLILPALITQSSPPLPTLAGGTATETPTLSALEIAQATVTAICREATLTAMTATRQARIDAALTEIVMNELATSITATPTLSETPTLTATQQPTTAPSLTATPSLTSTLTLTPTATASESPLPPTNTSTPINTPTATLTLTSTPQPTATTMPTLTPIPVGFAGNPVTNNAQWEATIKSFDDVEMVLVPAGCFDMSGSGNQCFEQPFWIDRYEVSNTQFRANDGRTSFNRASFNTEGNHPREYIYWSEAQTYCQQRGGRLPTGAEWEYAARGPDNLQYPWGNSFVANNAVYSDNSGNVSAPVGSRPNGASWVGAEDLSGNVWEWVDEAARGGNKVNRGGSFDYWRDQQTAIASKANADATANFNIGLRCARDFDSADLP